MVCALYKRLLDYTLELYQDGGYLGWMGVLGTFAAGMTWNGMTKGLAVLLPSLQEQFDTSTWLLGWMIAIIDGVSDLAGTVNDKFSSQGSVLRTSALKPLDNIGKTEKQKCSQIYT